MSTRTLKRPSASVLCVVIFVLAALVKLSYLSSIQPLHIDSLRLDALVHHNWASSIASGEWNENNKIFRDEPFYRAPLYPYVVSILYRVFGPNPSVALYMNAFLGCLTCISLFRLGYVLGGRSTAVIAALLAIGYWPLTYFEGTLLISTLAVFLTTTSFALATIKNHTFAFLCSGLFIGLSVVARPTVLLLVPLLMLVIICANQRRAVAYFLFTALLPILIVVGRNSTIGHDLTLQVATNGGINFYIGNNQYSNGVVAVVPQTRADWWGGYWDSRTIATNDEDRSPIQQSAFWYKKGIDFWVESPRSAFRLLGRKLVITLGNQEASNNSQLHYKRGMSKVLRLMPIGAGVIMALGFFGMFFALKSRNRYALLLGASSAILLSTCLIFFTTSRFRLNGLVLLIPLAAMAVKSLGQEFQKSRNSAARHTIVVLVLAIVSLWNPYGVGALQNSRGTYSDAVSLYGRDPDGALVLVKKSINFDPTYAPAWKLLSNLLEGRGQFELAEEAASQSVKLDPEFASAHYAHAVALHKQSRLREAVLSYTKALAVEPFHFFSLLNRADANLRLGRLTAARRDLEMASSVDTGDVRLATGWGMYYIATEQPDSALLFLRRVSHRPEIQKLIGKLE